MILASSLCSDAESGEVVRPVREHFAAKHLALLFASDRAGFAQCGFFAVLIYGNPRPAEPARLRAPRQLIDILGQTRSRVGLDNLCLALDAHDARTVARILCDDQPVRARLAQIMLRTIAELNGLKQRIFAASVRQIG